MNIGNIGNVNIRNVNIGNVTTGKTQTPETSGTQMQKRKLCFLTSETQFCVHDVHGSFLLQSRRRFPRGRQYRSPVYGRSQKRQHRKPMSINEKQKRRKDAHMRKTRSRNTGNATRIINANIMNVNISITNIRNIRT